jgi:hypothetical protein
MTKNKVTFTFTYPEQIDQQLFSYLWAQFEFIVNQKTGYKGYNYKLTTDEYFEICTGKNADGTDQMKKYKGNEALTYKTFIEEMKGSDISFIQWLEVYGTPAE